MSKPIRAFKKDQQAEVIARRLKAKTYGLGYWGAVGAQKKVDPSFQHKEKHGPRKAA